MLIARRHPHFGRLLAALATSQCGDWLYNLALLAYMQQRTHSATWVGIATGARVAPILVGGPIGGVLADRLDRRWLMIGSDAIRAAIMGALVLVAVTGLPVVLVPLLAAASTLSGAVYPPTVAALTPRLVDPDSLPAANAARGSITPACVAAGPALGALLLLIGPAPLVFAANAATFVFSGLIVASIPGGDAFVSAPRSPERGNANGALDALRGVLGELRSGAAALRGVPEAIAVVAADTTASFVYGAQTVLLLLVAHRLGLGAGGYGYLLAAQGAGGILGATLAGRIGAAGQRHLAVIVALTLVAAPLPVLAFTSSVGVAMVVCVIAGIGALLVEVIAETRLQQTLDEARIGRAYGLVFTVSLGGIVAGGLVAPILVAIVGAGGALCVVAAAVVLVTVAIASAGHLRPTLGPPLAITDV
jgi:MFS family permease